VKAAALHRLAQYLTGEECQMERFEALSWGPSNVAAQASDAVQANPGLAALIKQAPYSVPQGQIHGSWWDIGKVIADDVKAATDEAGLQAALDNYTDKISAQHCPPHRQQDIQSHLQDNTGVIGLTWLTRP
jgi:arabinogalactan oligomer/maltooligosaccharide transport system substrate-binding protein